MPYPYLQVHSQKHMGTQKPCTFSTKEVRLFYSPYDILSRQTDTLNHPTLWCWLYEAGAALGRSITYYACLTVCYSHRSLDLASA